MLRARIDEAGYRDRPVLRDLDLYLEGEKILIAGASGSGKTTLFLAVTGVLSHLLNGYVDGEVDISGYNPLEEGLEGVAERIGIVLQDPERQLAMPVVRDEVLFTMENLGLEPDEEYVEELLARFGLEGMGGRHVEELSGGEKRRLTMLTAVAHNPDTVLLDEPTASLDPWGIRDVRSFLEGLDEAVIIEHKAGYFVDLVDRTYVLRDGRLVETDPEKLEEMGVDTSPRRRLPRVTVERRGLALEARDLVVGYDEPVVEGVDLVVERGEAVAIVGPNGSGKSTLLKTIARFIDPLDGRIKLYTEPLYLPQEPDIFFLHSTVRDEILSVSGKEALDLFPRDLHPMPPYLLSHGERRRLLHLLARLYGHGLILMDEPTTGLDLENYLSIASELVEMKRVGRALLIATHDPRLVLDVCDRAYIIDGGLREAGSEEAAEYLLEPVMGLA